MSSFKRALVIVDMQREFADEKGLSFFPSFRTVLKPIETVLNKIRENGKMPIIHVRTVWRKDGSDIAPHTTSVELRERGAREGSWGVEFMPELAPRSGEHIVEKKRYSSFYMTDLELLLRSNNCKEVVFVGCATNFCVRCSVEDAANRDFEPIVISDCVAGSSEEGHRETLNDIQLGFGRVMTTREFLQTLD